MSTPCYPLAKRLTRLSLLAMGLIVLACASPARADILFYGGDFAPNNQNANGLANETDAIVGGSPTGASTYQNFVVTGQPWTVQGLFSNNLLGFAPTSAYWEIRTGVSAGNGGTLIASGTMLSPLVTATGRSGFGFNESTVEVTGLNIVLNPGTYWFTVTPQNPGASGRSYNSNTFGLNAVGTDIANQQFFNSGFFGANFANANTQGVFPTFSSGVLGALLVPEPGSITLFGFATSLLGLWHWRRARK